jgi:hypothetical protein
MTGTLAAIGISAAILAAYALGRRAGHANAERDLDAQRATIARLLEDAQRRERAEAHREMMRQMDWGPPRPCRPALRVVRGGE